MIEIIKIINPKAVLKETREAPARSEWRKSPELEMRGGGSPCQRTLYTIVTFVQPNLNTFESTEETVFQKITAFQN